jgi:hypothetical protein
LVENASNFRTREGGSPSTQPFPNEDNFSLDDSASRIVRHGVNIKMGASMNTKLKNFLEQKRRDLLDLLSTKYLFRQDYLGNRIALLNPIEKSDLRQPFGFTVNTKNGAPFVLGAVIEETGRETTLDMSCFFSLSKCAFDSSAEATIDLTSTRKSSPSGVSGSQVAPL